MGRAGSPEGWAQAGPGHLLKAKPAGLDNGLGMGFERHQGDFHTGNINRHRMELPSTSQSSGGGAGGGGRV